MHRESLPAEMQHEMQKSYEELRREKQAQLDELTKKFADTETGGNRDERRWVSKQIDAVMHEIEELDRNHRQAA